MTSTNQRNAPASCTTAPQPHTAHGIGGGRRRIFHSVLAFRGSLYPSGCALHSLPLSSLTRALSRSPRRRSVSSFSAQLLAPLSFPPLLSSLLSPSRRRRTLTTPPKTALHRRLAPRKPFSPPFLSGARARACGFRRWILFVSIRFPNLPKTSRTAKRSFDDASTGVGFFFSFLRF